MSETQMLTIASGTVPTFLVVLVGILINNSRLSDLRADIDGQITGLRAQLSGQIAATRDLLRAELLRVEQVMDARLRHLEEIGKTAGAT
ncbi:MAG: hypothetical protein ABSH49_12770 [Bryobacteraceae bacterium]